MNRFLRSFGATTAFFAAALLGTPFASAQAPLRIGVITFLSGPAAGPFGVPAKNASDVLMDALNKGGQIPGYERKGFGGRPLEVVYVDEAGGPTKVVTEYRNLVARQDVDMVIGVISSGDCLAVAPVAEELKQFTVLFDCATNRIFEEASYKYVFRTTTMATQENVAAARYIAESFPNLKTFSGVNPNYAWGQDAWSDFTEAMKIIKPQVQIGTNVTPKLGAGQYGTEVSAVLGSGAEIVQNSLWGGDLEAFILQAAPRGLLARMPNIMITGETVLDRLGDQLPDGTMIGARGPNGPFAPPTTLNKWFQKAFKERFGVAPVYASYHMATAFMGAKAAFEKAQAANKVLDPTIDQIIGAFEYLKFESVAGTVDMSLGKGHQAVQHVPYGTVRKVDGKLTLTNIKYYTPEHISPPDGMKSIDWIRSGFKR
ncbi:MAG TPA: ABC transporter substrate-binding protein [Burkholderiales bacterium]|jgi:branched-chain amino acid transport system substrate-binding protein|nr:ABC transporter substrate-binding protein [Burkholderiales bacterium]